MHLPQPANNTNRNLLFQHEFEDRRSVALRQEKSSQPHRGIKILLSLDFSPEAGEKTRLGRASRPALIGIFPGNPFEKVSGREFE